MSDKRGTDWNELRKELFTAEEILECDKRVNLISCAIKADKEQNSSETNHDAKRGVNL